MSDTPRTDAVLAKAPAHPLDMPGSRTLVSPAPDLLDLCYELEREVRARDERIAELEQALRAYVLAQGRMLDRWADGDDAVKQRLWKDLHACEEAGRAAIEVGRSQNMRSSDPGHGEPSSI